MKQEQKSDACNSRPVERDLLAHEIITGYCADIPCYIVDHLLNLYHDYGIWAALEAATAVKNVHEMHKSYGSKYGVRGGGPT